MAVTMTSASSSVPDSSRRPFSVKRSMWSVTTDAEPSRIAAKRSPFGHRAEALVPRVVLRREMRRRRRSPAAVGASAPSVKQRRICFG